VDLAVDLEEMVVVNLLPLRLSISVEGRVAEGRVAEETVDRQNFLFNI
jgi:hypothetical protein